MPNTHYIASLILYRERGSHTECCRIAGRCHSVTTVKHWVTCPDCRAELGLERIPKGDSRLASTRRRQPRDPEKVTHNE